MPGTLFADDPGAHGMNFVVDDDTNRYTSIGGNSITHDDAGNVTADKDGYTYEYDYENRIVKIEDSSSNDVAVRIGIASPSAGMLRRAGRFACHSFGEA